MEEIREMVRLWDEKKIINCQKLHDTYRANIKYKVICCSCHDDVQRAIDDLRKYANEKNEF
jgi:non-homologous end joining protein Ku